MAKAAQPVLGWWGARFQQYLLDEALLYEPLTRSQVKGAERGDARLSFERGAVSAVVGSGYANTVTLKIKPLTDRDWKKAAAAIAADADIARRFLSGTPGAELDRVLTAAGIDLFPTERAPAIRCDCSTRWDCRHIRVLAVRGAALLDANPFLWLEVLGRPRDAALAAVRAQMSDRAAAGQAEGGGAAVPVLAGRFLTTETDPDAIAVRPGLTVAPDALLKLLGPLPLPEEYRTVSFPAEREITHSGRTFRAVVAVSETADAALARYLAQISKGAAELAAGDRAPAYGDEAPVGKRIPLKHRLAQEIEAAAGPAETALSLVQLYPLCPTAAALPWPVAGPALADALTLLPREFLTLAGGYVGLRSNVLTGATFRHVISYTEWHRGRLSAGSDWEQALRVAGLEPPFELQVSGQVYHVLDPDHSRAHDVLFNQLRPEVGDELQVTVTDPEAPVLVGALVRRSERSYAGLLEADRAAARALMDYISDRDAWLTTAAEALELLLAQGYYREERPPDPVWLLPAAALTSGLYWGGDRTLTVHSWHKIDPAFGRNGYGVWQDRHVTSNQFATMLMKAGRTRRESEAALACVEAWCRHWPADQRDVRRPPTVAALATFLWTVAPLQVKQVGDTAPQVLAAWFRFLAERYPGLEGTFREHLAICELAPAFAHRHRTAPDTRHRDALAAWLLEGYRWLGPELVFAPGK